MKIKRYKKNTNKFFPQLVHVFKRVWQFDKKLVFIIFLSIMTSAASPFPNIIFSRYVIDALVSGDDYKKVLWYAGIMFFINYFITNLTVVLNQHKSIRSIQMSNTLANTVRKKCLEMDYEMFNNTAMQERATLALSLSSNNNFVSLLDGVSLLFSNIIILAGVIFIVIQLDFVLIVIALAVVTIQSIFYFKNSRTNMKIDTDSSIANRCINYLVPLFIKPRIKKDIDVYKISSYLLHKLNVFLGSWMNIFIQRTKINIRNSLLTSAVSFVFQLAVYIILGYKVFKKQITIGSFNMGIHSLNSFVSATQGISQAIIDVRLKMTFINKYDTFLKIPNQSAKNEKRGLEGIDLQNITIEFEHVFFKYPGSTSYVLKDIHFKINARERVAVVGENGAGKTTFILLLTRMYSPTKGRILINGIDILEINYDLYMHLFSTVYQDFLMLPFSIKENITFSEEKDNKSEERIMNLLKQSGMEDRIKLLYQGINTPVTKEIDARGVDFSGGEIQRIAIIRALYKDAPVIILDEPTSALDPVAEYEIYHQFAQMTHMKTAIYISHRIASTRFCDKIIVFQKGRIAETGTFEELLSKEGLYYDYYQKQAQYFNE